MVGSNSNQYNCTVNYIIIKHLKQYMIGPTGRLFSLTGFHKTKLLLTSFVCVYVFFFLSLGPLLHIFQKKVLCYMKKVQQRSREVMVQMEPGSLAVLSDIPESTCCHTLHFCTLHVRKGDRNCLDKKQQLKQVWNLSNPSLMLILTATLTHRCGYEKSCQLQPLQVKPCPRTMSIPDPIGFISYILDTTIIIIIQPELGLVYGLGSNSK